MAEQKTPMKFPSSILDDFVYEKAVIPLPNEAIKSLLASEQLFNLLEGIKFIENYFLNRSIHHITAKELEKFIKALHGKVAYSLLSTQGLIAGEYIRKRAFICKETGRADLQYGKSVIEFNKQTYNTLIQIEGIQAAKQYKEFCEAFCEKFRRAGIKNLSEKTSILEKQYEINKIDVVDFIFAHKLNEHPGYKVFLKTTDFSVKPEEMPDKMAAFCENLIKLIRDNAPPDKICAQALELTQLHPFANGNGRVARLLANTLLMQSGSKPINFEKYKKDYYKAIESKEKGAVEKFIEKLRRNNDELQTGEMAISDYPCANFTPEEYGYTYIQHEQHIVGIHRENFEAYIRYFTTMQEDGQTFQRNTFQGMSQLSEDKLKEIFRNTLENIPSSEMNEQRKNLIDMDLPKGLFKQTVLGCMQQSLISTKIDSSFKETLQEQLDHIILQKIDAKWWHEKAMQYKDNFFEFSRYCFIRAADFFSLQSPQPREQIAKCYIEAANLCTNPESAYGYVIQAINFLSQENKDFSNLAAKLNFLDKEGILNKKLKQLHSVKLAPDSPITQQGNAHSVLVQRMEEVIGNKKNNFEKLLTVISEKQYNRALRMICNYSNEKKALQLAKCLLQFKEQLNINVNEQAGANQFGAIHYAAKHQYKELYSVLQEYGANTSLPDKEENTPESMFKKLTLS